MPDSSGFYRVMSPGIDVLSFIYYVHCVFGVTLFIIYDIWVCLRTTECDVGRRSI